MKLFINIVIKRIYVFYTVAWNCRTKKGFPVCKKENLAGLQAHRKRGKALVPVHHTLVKPAETWSALVNIRRKALESSVGFRKRMTSRSPRGIYIYLWLMYTSTSIVYSDLSDDLMFVSRSCLAFSIIPRLIQTRRCHCPRLKDVLKFQSFSCSAG